MTSSKYCQCQNCKKIFKLTPLIKKQVDKTDRNIIECPFCSSQNIAFISFGQYLEGLKNNYKIRGNKI